MGTTGVGSFLLQEIDDMGQNHQHPKMDDSILKTILIFNHPRPSARLWSFPAHGATPAIGAGSFRAPQRYHCFVFRHADVAEVEGLNRNWFPVYRWMQHELQTD